MKHFDFKRARSGERGNVLFLILIAVALFAALSYAVTQSTRSGSNDSNQEQSLISSAQITQYPAGVRTALVRMIIGGTGAEELYFDPPSDFGTCGGCIDDSDGDPLDEERAVFHPAGGGAPYQVAQPDIIAGETQQAWVFSSNWEIDQIGTGDDDVTSATGNDIIAFLPNVKPGICRRINEELGISIAGDTDGDDVPPTATAFTNTPTVVDDNMEIDNAGISTAARGQVIDGPFTGQPYGCYDGSDGDGTAGNGPFIYYHVLIER